MKTTYFQKQFLPGNFIQEIFNLEIKSLFNFLRLRFEHKRIRVNQYRRVFARAWLKFRFGEEETNLCVIRNAVRSDHFFSAENLEWAARHLSTIETNYEIGPGKIYYFYQAKSK